MKNISTNKIDNKNILIVKMDKSMLCEVSQIASKTLGSSFVNEDIFDNDINLCAKIDEEIVAYATTKFREPLIINYQEHFSNLSRNFS